MSITIVSLILYFILVFDFTLTASFNKKIIIIEYSGLIWVGLDYYTIWKYSSSDKPKEWIVIKNYNNE